MDPRSRGAAAGHEFTIPRRDAPGLCQKFPYPLKRGRREHRVRAAPAVSCAKLHKKTHTSIQVQRRQSGIPCAMVLTLISRSPRRIGLCCLRRLRIWFCPPGRARKTSADLTPTSEAPGPHDFAVRFSAVRLRAGPIAHGKPALQSPQARGHCRVHRSPPQRS